MRILPRLAFVQVAPVLVAFVLVSFAACGKPPPEMPPRPPSAVEVVLSTKADVPRYLDEIGKCVPRESVSIQPQVSGRITEIHFQDGADVAKGDLLFTIDARVYQAKLDAAEANLAQAKASRDLAKQELARVESLTDPRAMSQLEKDQKKAAFDVAEATVLQMESATRSARIDFEYCTIRSPIDGRTGRRLVDVGNIVSPAFGPGVGTTLLVVQKLDPVYAEFTIPENDLSSVQKHMAAGTLEVEVRLPDDDGSEPRKGELSFLDNAVQDRSGTVRLRATVPNQDRRFWPGRFVNVRLVLERIHDAVLVPAAATQLSAQGPFVYVVKDDSTAELRPITPGQRQGDHVVVAKGLEAGEKVVVQGHVGVMPGAPVRIVEPGAPPGAPVAPGAKPAEAKPADAKPGEAQPAGAKSSSKVAGSGS